MNIELIRNSRNKKPLTLKGSVAVIGNSDLLLNGKAGKDIDRHDHVFRFNLASTDLAHKESVGSKVDFYFLSPMVTTYRQQEKNQKKCEPYSKEQIDSFRMICRKSQVICYEGHTNNVLPFNKRPYVITAELNDINYIFYKILGHRNWHFSEDHNPRNGIKLIACILKSGIKPNLYGFDIEERGNNNHYFDDEVQKDFPDWGHMPSVEYQLLKELSDKKLVILN